MWTEQLVCGCVSFKVELAWNETEKIRVLEWVPSNIQWNWFEELSIRHTTLQRHSNMAIFFIYLFVCGHARTNISKPKTTEKIWGKNHTYTGKWCFVKKKNKEKKWRNTKQRNNVEHVISSSCWNECFWLDIDTINQICIFIAHQSELSSIIENLIKMVGGAHVGDIHFVV